MFAKEEPNSINRPTLAYDSVTVTSFVRIVRLLSVAPPVNCGATNRAYPVRLGITSVVATVRVPILTEPVNVCEVAIYEIAPPPAVFATPPVHMIQLS